MLVKPTFAKCNDEAKHFIDLKNATERYVANSKITFHLQKIYFFLLPFLYFLCWLIALNYNSSKALYFILFGMMGILTVIIFVNLIHEAAHNLLFERKSYNQIAMRLFDCLGANSYIWKIRHIRMHHNYPNTIGWDCDIEQSGPIKIFPSKKRNFIQKYQHYWIFFLYPMFLLNWLLIRDFKDFYSSKRYIKKIINIPVKEYYTLWFFKFFFITYTLLIPIFIFDIEVSQALIGFLIQMICGSLLGMVILLTPHVNTQNSFPIPNEKEELTSTWLRHQFITTNDINGDNFFSKYIMNNFNYHIAHHLFPNLMAEHTKEATKIIKDFAKNYDFPYKCYSMWDAFKFHYQLVKRNAIRPQNILEETM